MVVSCIGVPWIDRNRGWPGKREVASAGSSYSGRIDPADATGHEANRVLPGLPPKPNGSLSGKSERRFQKFPTNKNVAELGASVRRERLPKRSTGPIVGSKWRSAGFAGREAAVPPQKMISRGQKTRSYFRHVSRLFRPAQQKTPLLVLIIHMKSTRAPEFRQGESGIIVARYRESSGINTLSTGHSTA